MCLLTYSEVAKDLGRKNMAKGNSREKKHHLESVQCEKGSLRHIQTVVGSSFHGLWLLLQARQTKPSTASGHLQYLAVLACKAIHAMEIPVGAYLFLRSSQGSQLLSF